MRLTLRTMLCYLDDVLDAADRKELGTKIEQSEYASDIVHRIRTSMRRLRLTAPEPMGEGMGRDANTVADYIDNTLPPEQVADFERVCLETDSEMHLAEVAASHQILTLVLGEPAEVPMSMRQRVYGLGYLDEQAITATAAATATVDAPPVAAGNGAMATSKLAEPPITSEALPSADPSQQHRVDSPEPASKHRDKPEIPEYLKQGRRRVWPLAITALLLAILLGGIALAVWRPGFRSTAMVDPNTPEGGIDQGDPLFNTGPPAIRSQGVDDKTAGDSTAIPPATEEGIGGPKVTPPVATVENEIRADDLNLNPARDDVLGEAASGDGTDKAATVGGASDDADPDAIARIDPPAIPADAPELPLVDKVAAHFISAGQVMVVWDDAATAWKRVAQRATLKPGAQLRSLPTYRPTLLLTNDLQITLADEGIASIGNPIDGVPAMELPVGQAVIATMGKAGNQLALRAGDRELLLTMVDADAAIAIGVYPFHLPGENPETERPHLNIVAFVTGGQVTWQQEGAKPLTLDAGQQIAMLDDGLPSVTIFESPPKWVRAADISDIDRLASATLEPLVDDDRPMEILLEEKAEHPRVEVRSLAARSLASLDKFDRLIDTLGEESLKSYWSDHFDRLQAGLARGPEVAAKVRAAVERRKGADAERFYRLLWGYSPEQLSKGDDKILVDYLKHDALDVRVLAINNLRRITGRTQGYHPHLPEARRRTAQREWEQAAASHAITYLNLPPDLPKRKPVE